MAGLRTSLFLAAVPHKEVEVLAKEIDLVSFPQQAVLYDAGQEVPYVYFPTTAAVSMLTALEGGESVEVAVVAREGFVGLPVLFGHTHSFSRSLIQVPGDLARLPTKHVAEHRPRFPVLTRHMNRYAVLFLQQVFTSSGCNRFHSLEQRIARWLLEHDDRRPSPLEPFPFTHEFLAMMLGAHRSSVTQTTDRLQGQGLIEYRRGQMRVVRATDLANVACECYHVLKQALDEFVRELESRREP